MFIVLIIVSSLLFADEFKKPLTRLSVNYTNIASALNQSKLDAIDNNQTVDDISPNHDFFFRANRPTWIDITISVFVIGK
jgi:hypothetical protein